MHERRGLFESEITWIILRVFLANLLNNSAVGIGEGLIRESKTLESDDLCFGYYVSYGEQQRFCSVIETLIDFPHVYTLQVVIQEQESKEATYLVWPDRGDCNSSFFGLVLAYERAENLVD